MAKKEFVSVTSHYSKKKAYMLCLFTGMFGGHYYYVGRTKRGILASFTLNFFLLGWLSDLKKIRKGRFQDQYGEYLKA